MEFDNIVIDLGGTKRSKIKLDFDEKIIFYFADEDGESTQPLSFFTAHNLRSFKNEYEELLRKLDDKERQIEAYREKVDSLKKDNRAILDIMELY